MESALLAAQLVLLDTCTDRGWHKGRRELVSPVRESSFNRSLALLGWKQGPPSPFPLPPPSLLTSRTSQTKPNQTIMSTIFQAALTVTLVLAICELAFFAAVAV